MLQQPQGRSGRNLGSVTEHASRRASDGDRLDGSASPRRDASRPAGIGRWCHGCAVAPGLRRTGPCADAAQERHRLHGQSAPTKIAGAREVIEAVEAKVRHPAACSPNLDRPLRSRRRHCAKAPHARWKSCSCSGLSPKRCATTLAMVDTWCELYRLESVPAAVQLLHGTGASRHASLATDGILGYVALPQRGRPGNEQCA
jgi:hypothetical protein